MRTPLSSPTSATGPSAGASTGRPHGPPVDAPSARTSPLAGTVVAIDPGHNGSNYAHPEVINRRVDAVTMKKACDTTGTQTDTGYTEPEFTYDVARRLADRLRDRGARVVLTRRTNHGVGPCITERAAIGNRAHADAALSIHADGGPADGTGFHVIEPAHIRAKEVRIEPASSRLALAIRHAYREGTGEPYANYIGEDGLDRRDDLGGLNLSTVPKVFVECGNMRNPEDAARLSDSKFRERVAAGLAAGLANYLRAEDRAPA